MNNKLEDGDELFELDTELIDELATEIKRHRHDEYELLADDYEDEVLSESPGYISPSVVNPTERNELHEAYEVNIEENNDCSDESYDLEEISIGNDKEWIIEDLSIEIGLDENIDDTFPFDVVDEALEYGESESRDNLQDYDPNTNQLDNYEHRWEYYEPFGVDYDDGSLGSYDNSLINQEGLSRTERARQVALKVGLEYEWDEAGIELLTEIFSRYSWSATQVSLRRELMSGMQPVELELAEQAMEVWRMYPEFHEAYRLSGYLSCKYTTLPWTSALFLIRSFEGYPCIEEVEQLLLDIYDQWRNKFSLMLNYSSFINYLNYRIVALATLGATLTSHSKMIIVSLIMTACLYPQSIKRNYSITKIGIYNHSPHPVSLLIK